MSSFAHIIERNEPRNIKYTVNPNPYAKGSVIVECGNTKVYVTVTVEEGVPPFLKGKGEGWLTAEYSMLPSATHSRNRRERNGASGRTQEIQRLIGRALRSIVDMKKLGERTVQIDCDVIVADGGTRTTSISGAYVALSLAVKKLMADGLLKESPIIEQLAAISVGINTNGKAIADLNYEEDSTCETDMNVVMTRSGKFVEIQGTAEKNPFSHDQMMALMECAKNSLDVVFAKQSEVLA
ncbi:ribonuclease PH [Bacteriovorax sp. PP10]|uniref:Ribonuclease PH n=1 Tax=Bacteriovorax antarcticus TaxID=3088717 RepID=A0ABU5VRI7_9BACT|nr:ribonuclease PH [Bacteriovorax sp. PP10]MEA9355013.1 ribonuclease PH [Bacteriovorax sp. PP10]